MSVALRDPDEERRRQNWRNARAHGVDLVTNGMSTWGRAFAKTGLVISGLFRWIGSAPIVAAITIGVFAYIIGWSVLLTVCIVQGKLGYAIIVLAIGGASTSTVWQKFANMCRDIVGAIAD